MFELTVFPIHFIIMLLKYKITKSKIKYEVFLCKVNIEGEILFTLLCCNVTCLMNAVKVLRIETKNTILLGYSMNICLFKLKKMLKLSFRYSEQVLWHGLGTQLTTMCVVSSSITFLPTPNNCWTWIPKLL